MPVLVAVVQPALLNRVGGGEGEEALLPSRGAGERGRRSGCRLPPATMCSRVGGASLLPGPSRSVCGAR